MENQTVPQAQTPAVAAPSLGDLFVAQPSLEAAGGQLAAALALEAGFAQRWLAAVGTTGHLPDTLFAAAQQLLQARWLGQSLPSASAGAWLAQLDRDRRTAAEPSDSPLRLRLDACPGQSGCLHLDFAASLMDAPSAERLLAAIADTAADLLDRPDAALHDIRTLPEADRHDQLAAWNTTPSALDRTLTVPALFSRQAVAAPDAIALVEGDAAMRYGELDERTNRLAQRLQHLGMRAGDNVGPDAGAFDGRHRRHAGHPQGGRRLRAGAGGLSARARREHARAGGCHARADDRSASPLGAGRPHRRAARRV
jgi:hypothetical protein